MLPHNAYYVVFFNRGVPDPCGTVSSHIPESWSSYTPCLLYTSTVHGKGTYVAGLNRALVMEEHKKEIEADLDKAIQKGRSCGMEDSDLLELFHLLLEE